MLQFAVTSQAMQSAGAPTQVLPQSPFRKNIQFACNTASNIFITPLATTPGTAQGILIGSTLVYEMLWSTHGPMVTFPWFARALNVGQTLFVCEWFDYDDPWPKDHYTPEQIERMKQPPSYHGLVTDVHSADVMHEAIVQMNLARGRWRK